MQTAFWDQRYGESEYAYGEEPNRFFRQELDRLPAGTILLPAEGEGRQAVYAAKKGWTVTAFDQSREGQKKARQLAEKRGVHIEYLVNDFSSLPFSKGQFDVIGLIYAHFPADKKSGFHQQLMEWLRPGGTVIFEAFSKNHLDWLAKNEKVGGPKDAATLFSLEEISTDFSPCESVYLAEEVVELHEGRYHNGTGSVIRFVGRKK